MEVWHTQSGALKYESSWTVYGIQVRENQEGRKPSK